MDAAINRCIAYMAQTSSRGITYEAVDPEHHEMCYDPRTTRRPRTLIGAWFTVPVGRAISLSLSSVGGGSSSSSKFIRDDYSPWTALDVVRVSTRAVIRYL